MRVLCIGNSFSQDATRYLHQIARSAGYPLHVSNLFIGGCPLSRHFKNMHSGEKAYSLEFNGFATGHYVDLKEMLLSNADWDCITLQQASPLSTKYETYHPYLSALADYIRTLAPKAKLMIHETWAYEDGSDKLCRLMGYEKRGEMYADLHAAYLRAAEDIHADDIIPTGALMEELARLEIPPHRDTYHASLGAGRFAMGLLWYAVLTGHEIDEITFSDFDVPVDAETVQKVKNAVKNTLAAHEKGIAIC